MNIRNEKDDYDVKSYGEESILWILNRIEFCRERTMSANASTCSKKRKREENKHECLLCGYVTDCDSKLEVYLDCVSTIEKV